MKRITSLLLALAGTTHFAIAAEPARPAADDPMSATRSRVLELRTQAQNLRQDAEATHQRESAECRRKVLVNNCLSGAADRRLEKIEQARGIENELGALERDIRRYELSERRAERARRLSERKLPATVSVEGGKPTTLPAPGGQTETRAPAEKGNP